MPIQPPVRLNFKDVDLFRIASVFKQLAKREVSHDIKKGKGAVGSLFGSSSLSEGLLSNLEVAFGL